MEPIIEVVNVVATAPVCDAVDLERVGRMVDDTVYHPETFPGMVLRYKTPRCSVLLFRTGKTVCAGTKTSDDAAAGIGKVAETLRSVGVDAARNPSVRITNMVATAILGRDIRLENAARSLPRSMYEPEMFPSIICRMLDPKCTMLLFASGRLVCAGATSEAGIRRAVNQMASELRAKNLFSGA